MRKTMLIVEDEFMIAMDLQLMLERHGWQVMGPVGTVADALALVNEQLPSAALLDVNLGDGLVTAVAEFLQAHSVPFALASAYERPEEFGGEVLAGAPNAGKPTNERRVLAAIAKLRI
ncbi:MAG: response regulator [Sphingomicrobium sp.]|nr:response regulator [Sphingomonadales bacterium]